MGGGDNVDGSSFAERYLSTYFDGQHYNCMRLFGHCVPRVYPIETKVTDNFFHMIRPLILLVADGVLQP